MEIIVELLLWVLQFFAEALLQLSFELIAHFFGNAINPKLKRREPVEPWLAILGYGAVGALAGWLSLLIFPQLFIQSHASRMVNLLLTPLLAGLVMGRIGAWRLNKGKDIIRLDSFVYGLVFAFAMGLVRYFLAR